MPFGSFCCFAVLPAPADSFQFRHGLRTSTKFMEMMAIMKSLLLVIAPIAVWLAAATAFSQQIAPSLQGFWKLKVERSDFGPRPKPKMGFVNWGEHGWTFAIVTADGRLYADATSTDSGCTPVGVFPQLFVRGRDCDATACAFYTQAWQDDSSSWGHRTA